MEVSAVVRRRASWCGGKHPGSEEGVSKEREQ